MARDITSLSVVARAARVLGVAALVMGSASACSTLTEVVARSSIRSEVSERTGCPETAIDIDRLGPRTPRHFNRAVRWLPSVYRATGCGKRTLVDCPEWDSYDQKPVCRLSTD